MNKSFEKRLSVLESAARQSRLPNDPATRYALAEQIIDMGMLYDFDTHFAMHAKSYPADQHFSAMRDQELAPLGITYADAVDLCAWLTTVIYV